MEKRMEKRIVRKSREIRKNTFLILTLALIFCIGTFALGAQESRKERIYYESLKIQKGDTLWEIAETYKQDGEDIEHMIGKIMECNGMKTTNIKSGESIIVPVVVIE